MSRKKKILFGILIVILLIPLIPLYLHFFQTPPPNPTFADPKLLPELADDLLARIAESIEDHSDRTGITVSYKGDVNSDGVDDSIEFPPVEVSLSKPGRSSMIRMKRRGLFGYDSFGYSVVTSVGLDDINSDGFIDAWIADPGDGALRIYYGKRNSFYWFRSTIFLRGLREMCFLDLDEDGDLDLIGMKPVGFLVKSRKIYWMESKSVE